MFTSLIIKCQIFDLDMTEGPVLDEDIEFCYLLWIQDEHAFYDKKDIWHFIVNVVIFGDFV